MSDSEACYQRRDVAPRQLWLAVVVCAVLVVLVPVGVIAFIRALGEDGAPAVDLPVVAELPAHIVPSDRAEPLPAVRAVGAGALVVGCRRDCGAMVVMADGTQFTLADEPAAMIAVALSPDGRWLTLPGRGPMAVRELTGDRVHWVDSPAAGRGWVPWVWSPDSRWLLLVDVPLDVDESSSGDFVLLGYHLLDLTTGKGVPVGALPGREFVAVLPSGQLWAADVLRQGSDVPVRTVEIEVLDPTSPGSHSSFTIDATGWLEPGETLAESPGGDPEAALRSGVQMVLTPDGEGEYLPVFGDQSPPAAVLQVDRDRQVVRRQELADDQGRWWLAGQLGGVVLLAQSRVLPSSVTLHAATESGLQRLTTVESAFAVRVAGAAWHGGSAF